MLIYIVEDEADIRELESYALEKNGFEVRSFENGQEFWTAAKSCVPDLILLDVMLPGEDGFAILRRLRSEQAFIGIPVIMISARTAELDRVKGLDFGADDYLHPVLFCQILATLLLVCHFADLLSGDSPQTKIYRKILQCKIHSNFYCGRYSGNLLPINRPAKKR